MAGGHHGLQAVDRQGYRQRAFILRPGQRYLKNDDLGHARLWYERALKRIPDNPDLHFNYTYALTLTKDEPGEKDSPLLRILFFWKYQLSPATIRWIALVLNAVLWISLAVLAIRKKQILRPSILLIAAGTVIFSATAAFNYIEATRIKNAIILPAEVAVRSGFGDTATQLFVLHAGTRVRVERETDTHLLIRYTDDKIGWVKRADAGVI
ncbi:SH3 domain-containing protein [Desulfosarcina cetonica]|uniref:SH3 domain-containing protein n=1 Tax=Desulfosarcina cetonica TaxID=90730 RepID=UPI0012EE498B|nr:SH3 domain-containing protein [Desulfosarcina cetonica]